MKTPNVLRLIELSAECAEKYSMEMRDARARAFVAALSGALNPTDPELSDRVFALLRDEPQTKSPT